MYVQLLKENLTRFIEIRNELENVRPNKQLGSLYDYVELIHESINSVYHGETDKFYLAHYHALLRLGRLQALDKKKFVTAFLTHKRILLSIADQYIKDLDRAFQQYDQNKVTNNEKSRHSYNL